MLSRDSVGVIPFAPKNVAAKNLGTEIPVCFAEYGNKNSSTQNDISNSFHLTGPSLVFHPQT